VDRLRQIIRLQMKFQHGTKDDDNDDDDDGDDGGRRGIVRLLALFRFSGFFFCTISDLIIFLVVDFSNVLHILWRSGKFWYWRPQAEVRSTNVLHSFWANSSVYKYNNCVHCAVSYTNLVITA